MSVPPINRPLRIYIIARCARDAHDRTEEICVHLRPTFDVFLPHLRNPMNVEPHRIQRAVHDIDLQAIKDADIGLLLPPYGRDCAYEVGVFQGLRESDPKRKRLVIAFVQEDLTWLRDWMVKGGMDGVVTDRREVYEKLCNDDLALHCPIELIETLGELKETMMRMWDKKT